MLFSKAEKLFRAIENSDNDKILSLIKKTSDINCRDKAGNTPLVLSCRKGNLAAVRELCENGADVNIYNEEGESALLVSIREGFFEIASYLLEHGADADIKDNVGYGVLHAAAGFGHLAILEILLPLCSERDSPDVFGNTPLLYAAMYGHHNIVKHLLENGADPDIQNVNGNTPLFEAAAGGHELSARLLIENNARCDLANNDNVFPHTIAYNNEHYELSDIIRAEYEKNREILSGSDQTVPGSIETSEWLDSKTGKNASYRVIRQTIVGDYDSRDEGLHEYSGKLIKKEGKYYLFSEGLGTSTLIDSYPPRCLKKSDKLSWQDYSTYGVFFEKTLTIEK